MKFSTKAIEKMSEILAGEMKDQMVGAEDIRDIETGMREMLQKVGAAGLKRYLETRDEAQAMEKEKACECGGKQEYRFRREGVLLSVFGRVHYKRRYFSCTKCKKGESPLDKALILAPGEVTAGLGELMALAGVEAGFAEASRFLERLLLFEINDNSLRKETECFGELQKKLEMEQEEQSQQESWLQERLQKVGKPAGRLYGSIDGVMTPCRWEWREMKNIAWYQVEKRRPYQKRRHHASTVGEQKELQAYNITYHCDILPPDAFGRLFWSTACQRFADLYPELVFVCDGAVWIWKLIELYFPNAVQIVDWYHASQYLPPIAEAAFGNETPQYLSWLEQARSLLWDGEIETLIRDCQALATFPAAQKAIHDAVSYFSHNHKRMDYARFRQQGYFIGSGTVESAGKQIAGLRLKRAGAHWSLTGAVATAKARGAWLSDQWDLLASRRDALPLAL